MPAIQRTGERIICLSSRYPEPVSLCETWSGQLQGSLFGLAPDGVFRASKLKPGAVGSYSTFSPLPGLMQALAWAVCFLWHCPSGCLTASLPACIRQLLPGLRGIAPFGVRTFLLPRVTPEKAILRLSKIAHSIPWLRAANKTGFFNAIRPEPRGKR